MTNSTTFTRPGLGVLLLVVGLGSTACRPGRASTEPPLMPGGMSASAQAAFDSATIAFEAGDAALALDLFSAVLTEDSTLAAAWLGLHLAERALNRPGDGDSALNRARALIEPPLRTRGRGQPGPAT